MLEKGDEILMMIETKGKTVYNAIQ